jgi:hypothetical protein
VPRETTISVTMHPRVRLADWLGMSGMGMQVRYADTGETIQGMTGGSASGMRFDPDGLLRPGAPVEVEVRRAGERAYRLAFITETDGSSRASSAGE